jgi:hypothetical protein
MNNPVDISQAERGRVLANDRKVAEERRHSTFLDHARASADDDRGGRFALSGSSVTVIGASPSHEYPQQPSTAPSNQMAMMPDESRLGYSVNDQEPTGEAFEIAASSVEGDGAKQVGIPVGPVTPKLRRRL